MDQTHARVVIPTQAPSPPRVAAPIGSVVGGGPVTAPSGPAVGSTPGSVATGVAVPVVRRPLYGSGLALAGYELLLDAPGADDADRLEALVATLGGTVGVGALAGGGMLLVPVPGAVLDGSADLPTDVEERLHDERVVLAVAERDALAPGAADALQRLTHGGSRLCLVGSAWSPALRPLLGLFALARVDVARVGSAGLAALATRLRDRNIALIAGSVATLDQLEACRRVGARYLSGDLVARPPVVADRALAPSQLACLRLATALVRPDVDLTEVELAVRSDPALTMRVLKAVNSAAGGARQRVSSIRQAVVLLGPRALLGCVLTAGLSSGGSTCPPEAVEAVLLRAHMCELLGTTGLVGRPLDGSSAFTVGLVAGLDVLLGSDVADILAELPVDEAVEQAVLGQRGPLGAVLADVLAYEAGCSPQLVDVAGLREIHLNALGWAAPLVLGSPG